MPPDDIAPNWTPIDKAAALSGKSDRTLRRWVASGKLAHKRESGRLYVDLSSPVLASDETLPITDIATARQQIATLTAELATVKAVLSEVIGERDYLRQVHAMSLASQQKLIEAPRRWRWPWSKTED